MRRALTEAWEPRTFGLPPLTAAARRAEARRAAAALARRLGRDGGVDKAQGDRAAVDVRPFDGVLPVAAVPGGMRGARIVLGGGLGRGGLERGGATAVPARMMAEAGRVPCGGGPRVALALFEVVDGLASPATPEAMRAAEDEAALHAAPPSIEEIKRAVARVFEVSMTDMVSHRRTAELVAARQMVMFLARHLTGRSLPEIGRRLGGRDHTTVLHGVRRVAARIGRDEALGERIAAIGALLGIVFDFDGMDGVTGGGEGAP